jgi:hypothetical protein
MPSSVPGALDPPTAWLGSDGLCELGSERSGNRARGQAA